MQLYFIICADLVLHYLTCIQGTLLESHTGHQLSWTFSWSPILPPSKLQHSTLIFLTSCQSSWIQWVVHNNYDLMDWNIWIILHFLYQYYLQVVITGISRLKTGRTEFAFSFSFFFTHQKANSELELLLLN
jgi:hypothetical protein